VSESESPCRLDRVGRVELELGTPSSEPYPPVAVPLPRSSVPPTLASGEDHAGPSKLAPMAEIRSQYTPSLDLIRVVDRRVDNSGLMNP
jgi:hypothetical protein